MSNSLKEYQDYKDALLFIIEVNQYMLTAAEDGISPLYTILDSAYSSIIDRMVSTPGDAAGILLFGVDDVAQTSLEGCKVLLDLGIPKVEAVKGLRESIEGIFTSH